MDLGMVAKTRPGLILSIPPGDLERALLTLVPHTTSLRGGAFEVPTTASFLRPGAFNVQGLMTVPTSLALRFLGRLPEAQLRPVEAAVLQWLGLGS